MASIDDNNVKLDAINTIQEIEKKSPNMPGNYFMGLEVSSRSMRFLPHRILLN